MYRLTTPETRWVDFAEAGLPGLRVQFAPPERATIRAARMAAGLAAEAAREAGHADPSAVGDDAFVRTLCASAIKAWEGVGGPDSDDPLPVTAETVERFLSSPVLLDAAARLYAYPVLSLEAARATAKKAPSPSPNGSSATRAKPTAKVARPAKAKPPAKAAKAAPSGKAGSKTRTSPSPGR